MVEISVVIPVYNVEKYMCKCVDSVLAQTFTDFEIILVDDGSPDNSAAICDRYAAEHPNIRVIHKSNQGLGMARNSGMEIARGRYIFFLDSDDYIREDTLERLLRISREHGAQAVHGSHVRFTTPDIHDKDIAGAETVVIRGRENLRLNAICNFCTFPGEEASATPGSAWCALYDLEFIRRHNLTFVSEREYISEDYVFNYDLATRADCICGISDTLYRYRVNPDSLTRAPKDNVMERNTDYCEKIERRMLADGYDRSEAASRAFGYAASRIRAQYKYMFLSDIPFSLKMERARRWRAIPYFERMQREFDPSRMSRLHRLGYSLFLKSRFRTLFTLIATQNRVRKMMGKIDN